MKSNIKVIIGIILGVIIGISTTVGAATVFNSKDITYSSSSTTKKNVKDSLDELYTKASNVGKCPEGNLCRDSLVKNVQLGDYISMTPTATLYEIDAWVTGYRYKQTINPSELNLWRVISKNADGTVDVISEHISSKQVIFEGSNGYQYLIGQLNKIATSYSNTNYVSKARHIGYTDQVEFCSTLSNSACPGDNGAVVANSLLFYTLGGAESTSPDGSLNTYWFASRAITEDGKGYMAFYWDGGGIGGSGLKGDNWSSQEKRSVRPILTLKASVKIKSGDGKSAETAYQLG